jgi:HPt (histidine-containing phosphotransfer) domain-containing protein
VVTAELIRQLLPGFRAVAARRLDETEQALAGGGAQAAEIAHRELHTLAGEALLLGLAELGGRARAAEALARALAQGEAGAESSACLASLSELRALVAGLTDSSTEDGSAP